MRTKLQGRPTRVEADALTDVARWSLRAKARFPKTSRVHLRILYHGNCFDGCSSAGLFMRFFRERVQGGATARIDFAALAHGAGGASPLSTRLDGDENAILDFRYTQDPRLTWWFDHHVSAFQVPGDEAHFRADTSGRKFYDPNARSCARFLANTVEERFGFDTAPLRELIDWAEIIDGAQFPSARMPVELKEPALKLMTWVEANRDAALADRFIHDLVSRPLAEIADSPYIKEPLAPLLERHAGNVDLVRRHAAVDGDVVVLDLLDEGTSSLNKFIAYYLFPEARYSVTLLAARDQLRLSVGSNPWSPVARTHNIAAICERYGGGGHPVVGAIALPPSQIGAARAIMREIVTTLKA
jgi:hypothetical protein